MSGFSAPNVLYRFVCSRIPGVVKDLIKMRASQVEAFLETELVQGRNAISLTLVLSTLSSIFGGEILAW
jgi:hypothetical protein